MTSKGKHVFTCVRRILTDHPDLHSTKRGIRKRSRAEIRAVAAQGVLQEMISTSEGASKETVVELWANFEIAYAQERHTEDDLPEPLIGAEE